MGLLLTVLAYVALVIVSILGLGLAMFTVAVLRLEHSLKDIPSPKKRSFFLGNLGGLRELKEKTGLSTAALLAHMGHDLGPVFWLRVFWTAHFIVLSAEVTKELLLNSRHTKPQIVYRGFQSLYGYRFMGHGLVSEIDHEKWFHRRAIMNPAFRRKYIMGFMDSFNEGAEMLCRQLLKKADDKTEVQMLDELNNVTLDVISKTSFSMDTDAVRDPNCPFPSAITTTLKGMQLFFDKPWIAIAGSVMSRMEEYFDDALLFNPDRFKPSEDGSLPRHLYAYFPFSMGQRSCIGQQFALIEARVILGKLLQRFSFRLEQSQRQALLDELTTKPLDRCKNYISLKA